MSVIVGYCTKNAIYLGGDSRLTYGSNYMKLSNNDSKIWNNGNAIIGGVGLMSDLQSIHYSHLIASELNPDIIDGEYLFDLYPKLAEAALAHRGVAMEVGSSYSDYFATSLLIATHNGLFSMSPDGSVIKIEDYTSIGCASDIVNGYILAHKGDKITPEKLISDAIKNATKLDAGIDDNVILYKIPLFSEEVEKD